MNALNVLALPQVLMRLEQVRVSLEGARTYLFGSITTGRRPAGDLDVLVVCADDVDSDRARKIMSSVCADYPVHLMIMTFAEEAELEFIAGVDAIEVDGRNA
jgi:predicted nucleotidyltransferase